MQSYLLDIIIIIENTKTKNYDFYNNQYKKMIIRFMHRYTN